jgi:hypothetical protein
MTLEVTAMTDDDEIKSLPLTAPVPVAGWHFFKANRAKSYRLKRAGVIPTIKTGPRNELALMRVLARRLNNDPQKNGT